MLEGGRMSRKPMGVQAIANKIGFMMLVGLPNNL